MITLKLTQDQYDALCNLVLMERELIRDCDVESGDDEVEMYNAIGEPFGLEKWEDQ